MIKKLMNLTLFITLFMLAGCSSGSEFIGKWQNVKKKSDVIEIVRNGSDFLVIKSSKDLLTGQMETSKIPLKFIDNTLKLEAGLFSATLNYIKATDTLSNTSFMGIDEYKRIKGKWNEFRGLA